MHFVSELHNTAARKQPDGKVRCRREAAGGLGASCSSGTQEIHSLVNMLVLMTSTGFVIAVLTRPVGLFEETQVLIYILHLQANNQGADQAWGRVCIGVVPGAVSDRCSCQEAVPAAGAPMPIERTHRQLPV